LFAFICTPILCEFLQIMQTDMSIYPVTHPIYEAGCKIQGCGNREKREDALPQKARQVLTFFENMIH
ncbi:MAG: hypothetical protein R3Y62_00865, partial [Eubacteriales bacterium]